MELLYLWIEDFRQIKKQGFVFSSKFTFTVSENSGRYELQVSTNENYVNIYGGRIINVTALVGKNGSGKSSVLNCLKLVYGQLARLTSSLFFVYFDSSTKTIHTCYYQKGGISDMTPLTLSVKLKGSLPEGYKLLKEKPYRIIRHAGENGEVKDLDINFGDLACAYLTNSFDHHRETIYTGVANESTTQKLNDYLNLYVAAKERAAKNSAEKERTIELWPTHLEDFYRRELRRDIRFVQFVNDKLPDLLPNLPTSIVLNFNLDDYEYLLEQDDNPLLIDKQNLESIQKRALQELAIFKNQIEVFKGFLYLCTFYYGLRHELFKVRGGGSTEAILRHISILRNPVEPVLNAIKELIDNHLVEKDDPTAKRIADLFGPRLENAFKNATVDELAIERRDIYRFPFLIDHKLWNLLSLIYEFRNKSEFSFIDYNWYPPLSAGEEALLTHFARLYEIKRAIGTKPLMLLIDEVELYFHPEWQKNYMKYLIDAIKLIFSDNDVQIVLSTHSPFVVSDIPKQNLIFLQKDLKGKCIVADEQIQTETFGANIHELFTNSFFLQDGLMGKFAQKYINELIQDINNVDQINNEMFVNNFKKRIAIIGEQFIKTKILELVASKSDFQQVDEILRERENELDGLKRIREQKRKNDKDRNSGN